MFYSHDILTSPEHGVATIWLVATLGSRSITRRLNRKTILDVDVPKACNVIMDPQAPMALRLQGNLLYGVSRVYSQQCGYTLTDVQSMHDRMKTMLRILPGGALDPMAGKIRPDQLILPYDPSFTPENDLPGLDIDLAKLTLFAEPTSTEFAWPVTPDLSQSVLSQNPSLQLSFGSGAEDIVMADVGGSEPSSVHFDLNRLATSALHGEEEEGVLLQPDFEFDEDGNIIELSGQRRTFLPRFETPLVALEGDDLTLEYQEMPIDDMPPGSRENSPTPHSRPASKDASDKSPAANVAERSATVPQRRRKHKTVVVFDEQTALRNSELAQMNSEYMQNMASASRQKKQNRRQTQAKKNADFWVFGRGIGAVGVGVGASRVAHPLFGFSGQELIDLVSPEGKSRQNGRKRGRDAEGDSDTESGSEGRRVRAREEVEEQVGRGDCLQNNDVWNEEVEFGRHASSALRDDSSQMPWNITASVQSSRHGSSAANLFRGVGSSSWGMPDSAGLGRPRSRLASASPLAGRGFPFDVEDLDSLAIPGAQGDDIDVLGDFDLIQYLQTGLYADDYGGERATAPEGGAAGWKGSAALAKKLKNATLDQDSQNFLQFLVDKLSAAEDNIAEDTNDPFTGVTPIHALARSKETSFWDLLPPKDTSRPVATHGLMHILALATKGFLTVRQDAYEDLSNEDGVRYEYGEIFVRLAEV